MSARFCFEYKIVGKSGNLCLIIFFETTSLKEILSGPFYLNSAQTVWTSVCVSFRKFHLPFTDDHTTVWIWKVSWKWIGWRVTRLHNYNCYLSGFYDSMSDYRIMWQNFIMAIDRQIIAEPSSILSKCLYVYKLRQNSWHTKQFDSQ